MHKDYDIGYAKGFAEGWKAARISFEAHMKSVLDQSKATTPVLDQYKNCVVCGINKNNGDPFGVVCQHPNCPINATSIF